MNCQKCGHVLHVNMAKCFCGTKVPVMVPPRPRINIEPTDNAANRALGAKLAEVNRYVEDYQQENQISTKREACLAYTQEKNLIGVLHAAIPATIQSDEARAEREAIQAEGT